MKRILLLAFAVLMLFSGCAKENETANNTQTEVLSSQDTQSEYENDENVLNISMRTTTMLNPLLNKDESVDSVLRLMFEPLISLDNTNKPQGVIAESWYYTQDGTILTVKIKEGLLWHDGSAITANDVAYSINTILNSEDDTVYKKCTDNIRRVSVQDRYTIDIYFAEAFSGNIFSLCFPVISQSYYSSGDKDTLPMGSGPYKFLDFTPAKELVLEACDNSFVQKPSISKVVAKMTTDADTDVYSFSQKITDCVVIDEKDIGKYDFDSDVNKYSFNSNYFEFIGFNFNNQLLTDKNIRKAISCAVPIDNIIDSVYLSNAVKTSSPVNPSSFLYDNNIAAVRYDLNKAKEYLTAAGYKYDNNSGLFIKTDETGTHDINLRILVNKESKERRQIALKLADELTTLGIKSTVEAVDFATYQTKLETGDFDLFVGGWELSISPYFGFMFESSNSTGYNYISYSDENMDNLINAAYNSVNEADMIKAYSELEAYTAEELPYISLLFRKSALFVNGRIDGTFDPVPYDYFKNIESWHIGTGDKTE